MECVAQRRALSQQLRWLANGRITTDAFDDFLFDDDLLSSKDKTVAEIASWSWTLYSDAKDYRLRGPDALDDDRRGQAIRAILMLRSGHDYLWPSCETPLAAELFDAIRWFCLPLGGALAVITIMAIVHDIRWVGDVSMAAIMLGLLATVTTVWSVARYVSRELRRPGQEVFESAGDINTWPFLSSDDLQAACQHGHLLAKS